MHRKPKKRGYVPSYFLKYSLLGLEINCIEKEGDVKKVMFETEVNRITESTQSLRISSHSQESTKLYGLEVLSLQMIK